MTGSIKLTPEQSRAIQENRKRQREQWERARERRREQDRKMGTAAMVIYVSTLTFAIGMLIGSYL